MLKRLLLGSGIILTLAIGAAGQTDWKGFYAGGNVGVADARATADTSTIFTPPAISPAAALRRSTLAAGRK